MARPRKSRQLSPLIIPLVAGGLTLLLAGLIVFFSLNMVREVPVPGPTITVLAPPTVVPTSPTAEPKAPEQTTPGAGTVPEVVTPPKQDGTASQPQQAPVAPQGPVAPQPVAPIPQPQPQAPPVEQPAPPVDLPGIVGGIVGTGEDILCSLYCPF